MLYDHEGNIVPPDEEPNGNATAIRIVQVGVLGAVLITAIILGCVFLTLK